MHPDIKFDFNRMMTEALGPGHGISLKSLYALETQTQEIHKGIHAMRGMGQLPFVHLPYDEELLKKVEEAAQKYKGKIQDIVVCGIGGSALGTSSLYAALSPSSVPHLHVCDNIDPESFSQLLQKITLQKTLFVIISKSGGTTETMAQFLALQKLKGKKNLFIITDPEKGALRNYAKEHKIDSLEVPPGVGGRYSVFSAVGLFPLALAGVDIGELLLGASQVDKRCLNDHIWTNPAAMLAQLLYLSLKEKQKSELAFMPYSDSLYPIGGWFAQLWDESLGKRYSLKGEEIQTGQTVVACRGATDQHSQLQLFMEGPEDKVILFLVLEKWRKDLELGNGIGEASFLSNRKMGELMHTEWLATEKALTENKRSNLTLFIPEITAHSLGQLYHLLMLTTVYMGGLLNVNPFDQPGVELGKKYTHDLMKKKKFGSFKELIKKRGGEGKYWV